MGYIAIILFGIIILLVSRLFILRYELGRISKDLQDLNKGITDKRLTVTTLHKPIETLCQHINFSIKIRDKARSDAENHEAELRAQISNISHDLRTPLTAILGYLSMVKDTPEKAADYLEIIEGRSKA